MCIVSSQAKRQGPNGQSDFFCALGRLPISLHKLLIFLWNVRGRHFRGFLEAQLNDVPHMLVVKLKKVSSTILNSFSLRRSQEFLPSKSWSSKNNSHFCFRVCIANLEMERVKLVYVNICSNILIIFTSDFIVKTESICICLQNNINTCKNNFNKQPVKSPQR